MLPMGTWQRKGSEKEARQQSELSQRPWQVSEALNFEGRQKQVGKVLKPAAKQVQEQ